MFPVHLVVFVSACTATRKVDGVCLESTREGELADGCTQVNKWG